MDVEALRGRFPIFARRVYLNSCSQGALSDAVRAAYQDYLRDWDTHGAPWEYWVDRSEAARIAFAGLIGASPDEVAVTTSLSAGVDALVSALRFDTGRDTIVLSDFEFPTVGQIVHAQEARGARVVHVPATGPGEIPLERFAAAIDERTALVAVTAVCYRNGARLDVEGVVELAHAQGAPVLLDAYQAVGAVPVNVRAPAVDFLAAGVLKYLLGSAGLGFLYCRRDLIESLWPTATGWFADEDIFRMDIHDFSPAPTARRFEAGTPPVPSIYAGIAGMELIQEVGVPWITEHVRGLTGQLVAGAAALGGRVVTPRTDARPSPLVAIAATDDHALVRALAAEGIDTSCRDDNLRVSPHLYNTPDDIEALLAALARHRELVVPGDGAAGARAPA